MSFQARFRSNPSSILRAVGSVEFHSSRGTKPSPSPLRSSPEIFPIRRRLQVRFLSFFEKTERRLKKSTPEMGSPRRDLRSGAHLRRITAAGQRRSNLVNAGQTWSTPVNAGQRRSTPVDEFLKIAFPAYFRRSGHVYSLGFARWNLEG